MWDPASDESSIAGIARQPQLLARRRNKLYMLIYLECHPRQIEGLSHGQLPPALIGQAWRISVNFSSSPRNSARP